MYYQILNVIGPIFVITIIGYILEKMSKNIDSRTISSIVLLIATPSLVFSTLTSLDIDAATLLKMALSVVLCVAVASVAGLVVLRCCQ